jgi:hypothetical protein
MKHKSSKRSIYNKQFHHRSYQTQTRRSSVPIDHTHAISLNQIDLGIGTVHVESQTLCLKPNVSLRSQKLLKRDLLRCSNQRPSFLGVQTLPPSRHHHHHHGLQQTHSMASSSSTSSSFDRRRRSLSVNSHTFYATIDRIGPWPDISINRLRSSGNELLRPLKNFRHPKHHRLFSPKYYAALNDNAGKFQFHPSNRTYIEEYRKQKGYLLIPRSIQKQPTSLSLSSLKQVDDDQVSAIGTFSGGAGNSPARERSDLSTTNLTLSTRGKTKSADELLINNNNHITHEPFISFAKNQMNIFPTISIRNNNNNNQLRSIRPTQHHQAITLPAISKTSIRYLNSINSVGKAYVGNKKALKENESKLYLLDERPRKRYRIH